MADEAKPDAEAWGQEDWAASGSRSAPPPKRRWLLIAIASVVGLVLLAGVTILLRTSEVARQRTEVEHRMALEAQLQAEKVRGKIPSEPKEEPPLDPAEALRLMAFDPEALNKLGLFLLNQMDEPDEAIEKFREATKLDPKYAGNLELARKRQAQKDRTAPFPREVEQP